MRYHLFLNFVVKVVKIARTFCLDLAVRSYMSTSIIDTDILKTYVAMCDCNCFWVI